MNASWWKECVIYQVYPRSFFDSNGDGIGDLAGITEKLNHLVDLGVNTLWVSPFFKSPQADFGYDISDYCDVANEYGNLDDAKKLIDEAHAKGLRILFDLVLNHTSDQHPWFIDSKSSRNSQHADWYIWRDGRGPNGRLRPNNWRSGLEIKSAWHWSRERKQWYLGTFLPCQPDLNWRNPQVREAMFDAVRFWLDMGVDGFRLDMFGAIMKDPDFRSNPFHPYFEPSELFRLWRRDFTENTQDNFELAKELRSVCAKYEPERVLIGEVFGPPDVLKQYIGDGAGLHFTFLFDFLAFRFNKEYFTNRIRSYEKHFAPPFLPTYVVENHDRSRSFSRLGQDIFKAKVLALMMLTLRGVPVIYQGQELGMPNTYIPLAKAQDPIARQYFWWMPEAISKRLSERINRDEVRTPMQWTSKPNAGFCPENIQPWLPVNNNYLDCNVEIQSSYRNSLLNWYKEILHTRKECSSLSRGDLVLISNLPEHVLGYSRTYETETVYIYLNFSTRDEHIEVGKGKKVILSSDPGNLLGETLLKIAPYAGIALKEI